MPTECTAVRPTRRRWLVPAVLLVGLVGFTSWIMWGWLTAHSNLNRGKAALDADDPATARVILDQCLASWPRNAEAHFRAGQAARRCGIFKDAGTHLDEAARFGWDESAIDLERALIQAQAGDLRSAERILVPAVEQGHPDARHILAVLVPALTKEYRWLEANALAQKWLQLEPESAAAWRQQGEIFERLRKKNDAVNALREAVRRDPGERRTRFNLARMILETRGPPDEAAGHLEWLAQRDPGSQSVAVQMAVCREAQGLPDEAVAILDDVLAGPAPSAKAYYHRGRLEANRGQSAVAAPFLRRAAELDPSDVEILHSLFLCLRQVGTTAEAREAEDRWKRAEAELKRVSELARAIAADPHDPNLRLEMGQLFLRNGRDRDGLRWLQSALQERPDHVPTHQALADFYDGAGEPGLASYHRSFVRQLPGPGK